MPQESFGHLPGGNKRLFLLQFREGSDISRNCEGINKQLFSWKKRRHPNAPLSLPPQVGKQERQPKESGYPIAPASSPCIRDTAIPANLSRCTRCMCKMCKHTCNHLTSYIPNPWSSLSPSSRGTCVCVYVCVPRRPFFARATIQAIYIEICPSRLRNLLQPMVSTVLCQAPPEETCDAEAIKRNGHGLESPPLDLAIWSMSRSFAWPQHSDSWFSLSGPKILEIPSIKCSRGFGSHNSDSIMFQLTVLFTTHWSDCLPSEISSMRPMKACHSIHGGGYIDMYI